MFNVPRDRYGDAITGWLWNDVQSNNGVPQVTSLHLNVDQRRVLMLTPRRGEIEIPGATSASPPLDRSWRASQRVHEQTHHRTDLVDVGRLSRDDGPEHDVRLPAALAQSGARVLNRCSPSACRFVNASNASLSDSGSRGPDVRALRCSIDTGPRFAVERRRANETFERASPECLGLRQLLPSEPFDIVPVRTRRFQLELASFRMRPIEVQYFLDNQVDAPSIEQAVMKAPVKVVTVVREAYQA